MHSAFSGTTIARDAKKRQSDRSAEALRNNVVGVSRRQRDLDKAYNEQRENLKREMLRKQAEGSVDFNAIGRGRRKDLILIPNETTPRPRKVEQSPSPFIIQVDSTTEEVTKTTTETSDQAQAFNQEVKAEALVVSSAPTVESEPTMDSNELHRRLLNGLRGSAKKFSKSIDMVGRLLGQEAVDWRTEATTPLLYSLLFESLMSPTLLDVQYGGDARNAVKTRILPQLESIISTGIPLSGSVPNAIKGDIGRIPFSNEHRMRLTLGLTRAFIMISRFNDDSVIVDRSFTRLMALIEEHHREVVTDMVKKGQMTAYEMAAQVDGVEIKDAVALQDASSQAVGQESATETQASSGVLLFGSNKPSDRLAQAKEATLREEVIIQCLGTIVEMRNVSWAKKAVAQIFLKAYYYRSDFNEGNEHKIACWQNVIMESSNRSSRDGGVVKVGMSDRTVVDARTDRITYRAGADTWASKQKGVL